MKTNQPGTDGADLSLRPTSMRIDLDALVHNYRTLKSLSHGAKVMAVLKANAYGHGLIPCAKILEQECKVDYIGVALVEEGVELRAAGIKSPILIFGGLFNDQVGIYLENDLELTASSVSKLRTIDGVAKARNTIARVHIKIDTGMGRIGVRPSSAAELFKAARDCSNCKIVGIFTHFATSDEQDLTFAKTQLESFKKVVEQSKLSPSPLRHAANSGAVLQLPGSSFDMVRCGISLFGISPSEFLESKVEEVGLKPVMSVISRVVYFKVAHKGDSVSYGRTWIADKDTRIVTVPIGYGDGYFRALSNRGDVLIRGKRYPIVGRVCMDQIMVNIGSDEAYNGDEVMIVGSQGSERITIGSLARTCGTISYEVLTALNLRIPRRFVLSGNVVARE